MSSWGEGNPFGPFKNAFIVWVSTFSIGVSASIIALLINSKDEKLVKDNRMKLIGGMVGALVLNLGMISFWAMKKHYSIVAYIGVLDLITFALIYSFTRSIKDSFFKNRDVLISALVGWSALFGFFLGATTFISSSSCIAREAKKAQEIATAMADYPISKPGERYERKWVRVND